MILAVWLSASSMEAMTTTPRDVGKLGNGQKAGIRPTMERTPQKLIQLVHISVDPHGLFAWVMDGQGT